MYIFFYWLNSRPDIYLGQFSPTKIDRPNRRVRNANEVRIATRVIKTYAR